MIKVNEKTESFVQMIFWCSMWLVLLHMMVGCGGHSRKYYFGYDVYDAGEESKSMGKSAKALTPGRVD